MEQWNGEEKSESFEGWFCGSDSDIIDAIFDFLTAVGLNKKRSSLIEVLKELYLIHMLKVLKSEEIRDLTETDCASSMSKKEFEKVIAMIKKKYVEINCQDFSQEVKELIELREKIMRDRNLRIAEIDSDVQVKITDLSEDWESFYSKKKKDLGTIIDVITRERRPEVYKYEFSLQEKEIFWEILSDKDRKVLKVLKKIKNGNIDAMQKDELDIIVELLKIFEKKDIGKRMGGTRKENRDRIERDFCKSYIESMDAVESLKDVIAQCKNLIDYDKKYINLLYEVAEDIDKIKGKVNMALIKTRIELNIRKNSEGDKEN